MSTTFLCQLGRAETPYYISDVDINVWSLEELCYFMDYNLPLIDMDFFEDGLIEWINTDLKLRRLAREILMLRGGDNPVEKILYAINAECNWIYAEERELFRNEVRDILRLPEQFRLRRKADMLVKYRKYTRAIFVYRQVLQAESEEHLGVQFIGTIYHNMGVAYAKLFQLDEAAECLKEAYKILRNAGTLKNYLYCVRMNEGEEAFRHRAAELQVTDVMLAEMEEEIAGLRMKETNTDIDETLRDWVRQYHRETGL